MLTWLEIALLSTASLMVLVLIVRILAEVVTSANVCQQCTPHERIDKLEQLMQDRFDRLEKALEDSDRIVPLAGRKLNRTK